nr:SGNH/GDSL hydrolase family protein [Psychromicrobium silvestre]
MKRKRNRAWRGLGAGTAVVLLLSGCATAAGASAPITMEPSGKTDGAATTIVVVGDSISTGFQTSSADSWPSKLEQNFTAQGVALTLVNTAENGAGYLVAGSEGKTFEQQTENAIPGDTSVVIVYGSENDIGYDVSQISSQVVSTATAVRAQAPQAQILFVGPASYSSNVDPDLLSIRDRIQQGAKSAKADFVDPIAQRWIMDDEAELIGPDGDHPTVQGHLYLAAKFESLVAPLLKKG